MHSSLCHLSLQDGFFPSDFQSHVCRHKSQRNPKEGFQQLHDELFVDDSHKTCLHCVVISCLSMLDFLLRYDKSANHV